ncbi:CopG family ribbon-helix-helix protein [Haladaptatus sp. NG-SE-30]
MRTSLSVPDDVLSAFDETWQAQGLESRSRAVREAMSEYTEAHSQFEDVSGDIAAVLAFDYEHGSVVGDLHTIQHEFHEVINTTSHVHHDDWCLETVFCHGSAERVRELAYRLRDFDAVGRVKVLSIRAR